MKTRYVSLGVAVVLISIVSSACVIVNSNNRTLQKWDQRFASDGITVVHLDLVSSGIGRIAIVINLKSYEAFVDVLKEYNITTIYYYHNYWYAFRPNSNYQYAWSFWAFQDRKWF